MFKKILGRKKGETSSTDKANFDLINKIDTMNLTQMRTYANNKIKDLEVSREGFLIILKKLITPSSKTKQLYITMEDMDSKKKKAFDLVLIIAQSNKINVEVIEIIQKFILTFTDMITRYDTDNKEIYASRFDEAITKMVQNINHLASLQNKFNVLNK